MKLLYRKTNAIHRFDIIGDFVTQDLDVLRNSLTTFFTQLEKSQESLPAVVIDFSDCTVKVSETSLQTLITEMKTITTASRISMIVAQSDIESIYADQRVIEQGLQAQLSILENRIALAESVKEQIRTAEQENAELREKLNHRNESRKSRGLFEKLWGES